RVHRCSMSFPTRRSSDLYAGYLYPFTPVQGKAISGGLVVLIVILLYRRIGTIGKISVLLWIGVVGTMLWLIWGGATHFNAKIARSEEHTSELPSPDHLVC